MHHEKLQRFFGIAGHVPQTVRFLDAAGQDTTADGAVQEVVVELSRTEPRFRCPCGREFTGYYDREERRVRDLPWGPWTKVSLAVPRYRVNCPDCGVKTEPLSWLVPNCTYTRRLAEAVALACREVRALSAIAPAFELSWDTVRRIDQDAMAATLDPPVFPPLKHLALDEISLRGKHLYATVFLDYERHRVLWLCLGRDKDAVVRAFRAVFGPAALAGVKAVAMDWGKGYEQAVRECLPHAQIVWDWFHLIRFYNREVVDRVRIVETRKLREPDTRAHLKRHKWLLLRNPKALSADEPATLKQLLGLNRRLAAVYILREVLRRIWEMRDRRRALTWFQGWYRRAAGRRIADLADFARKLQDRLHGLLAHCDHPLHNGVLEGVNNKIKVIKRIAYGYRNFDYFFLKVRAQYQPTPH